MSDRSAQFPSPPLGEKVASVSEPDEGEARKRHQPVRLKDRSFLRALARQTLTLPAARGPSLSRNAGEGFEADP